MNKELSISTEAVMQKFRETYPREFSHVIAEVRADTLQARVTELEALAEPEEDEET